MYIDLYGEEEQQDKKQSMLFYFKTLPQFKLTIIKTSQKHGTIAQGTIFNIL